MHFSATYRYNPQTGNNEPYYHLKETYRDSAGIVRSRIVLSPGFIKLGFAWLDICKALKQFKRFTISLQNYHTKK